MHLALSTYMYIYIRTHTVVCVYAHVQYVPLSLYVFNTRSKKRRRKKKKTQQNLSTQTQKSGPLNPLEPRRNSPSLIRFLNLRRVHVELATCAGLRRDSAAGEGGRGERFSGPSSPHYVCEPNGARAEVMLTQGEIGKPK